MSRPKSAKLLKLEGTYRKDRHSSRRESIVDEVILPDMPDFLEGEAKAEWDRCINLMADEGILHRLNRSLLVQYCVMWADLSLDTEKGAAFHTSFRMVANDLGFTPSGMLKFPKKPDDKKEENFTSGL